MEEIRELMEMAQTGDEEARVVLIEKNLGLVHMIVRRFSYSEVDPEDLFQIGCIGLMKAIDRFDLSLQLQFSTYAVPVITGEIKRFLRDDGPVKISRTIKEHRYKIEKAKKALEERGHKTPTVQELEKETGLSKEDILLALDANPRVESIYERVNHEDGAAMYMVDRMRLCEEGVMPVTSCKGGYCEDEEKERLMNHLLISQLLEELEERDRTLIILRFFKNKTQMETAAVLGISQVQVSRLEKSVLRKLREKIH